MAKDFTSQAGAFMQAEASKKAEPKQKTKASKTTAGTSRKPLKMGIIKNGQLEMTGADNIPIGYELKPESKSKRLNLLIRPSIYEALKDKAGAAGTSVNDYINNLIEKDINK